MTFSDVLNFCREAEYLNTSNYQIYSNRMQINVKRADTNIANIVFDDEKATVYRCPRNGYCDYSNPVHYSMDDEVPTWAWNGAIEI